MSIADELGALTTTLKGLRAQLRKDNDASGLSEIPLSTFVKRYRR